MRLDRQHSMFSFFDNFDVNFEEKSADTTTTTTTATTTTETPEPDQTQIPSCPGIKYPVRGIPPSDFFDTYGLTIGGQQLPRS